jgi:hypothetical protein
MTASNAVPLEEKELKTVQEAHNCVTMPWLALMQWRMFQKYLSAVDDANGLA